MSDKLPIDSGKAHYPLRSLQALGSRVRASGRITFEFEVLMPSAAPKKFAYVPALKAAVEAKSRATKPN